jgi:uncharacterized protein YceK
MRKFFMLLAIAATVAGCASTLPSCDGKNRRPVNTPARAEVFYPSCGATA